MKSILLAAGIGKRLQPITNSIPKPMINIAGKPIIEYILTDLSKFGYNDFCIVVGHESKKLIDYFENQNNKNFKITFVTQKELSGTANAVYSAKEFVKNEPFLVYLCDTIIPTDLGDFLKNIEKINDDLALLSSKSFFNDLSSVGTIAIENSYVKQILEKSDNPSSKYAWAGLAFFRDNSIFKIIENMSSSKNNEYDLTEAMNIALNSNKKIKNFTCNKFIDFGTVKGLLEGSKFILSQNSNLKESKISTNLDENLGHKIGENTLIGKNVYLGENSSIGRNSKIGPDVSISKNCQIGDDTNLSNCIVLENSIVENNKTFSNMIISGENKLNDSC